MVKTGRALISALLTASLAVPPAFAAPQASSAQVPVTKELMLKAGDIYADPEAALERLTPGAAPSERGSLLRQRSRALLSKGARVTNEIVQFQAMIILLAALSFQASREHREMVRLSNGQLPENQKSTGACAPGDGVMSELLCSGEFWLGAVGGAGFLAANSVGGMMIRKLAKDAAGRAALFKYLSAMASGAFLMFGAQASSFLWTEGVKALPSPEFIQKSHGIAGRALLNITDWKTYSASTDGKLFHTILENMWNILVSDTNLRNQWIYNTWRFGIARGEFIAAISVIMGAGVAGEAATAMAASLGWAAPVVGFIVCAALGFGAMTLIFDANAPQMLTKAMQGLRQFSASSSLRRTRAELQVLMKSGFDVSRYPQAGTEGYIQVYEGFAAPLIERLQSARESYVNVAIERYYELLNEQKSLEAKIQIAETAVRNAALQKNLFIEVGGEVLSFEQAKEKLCGTDKVRCQQVIGEQLDTLGKLRPLVSASREQLTASVKNVAAEYLSDSDMALRLLRDPRLMFPLPLTERLSQFQERSEAVGMGLTIVLGGSDPVVAQNVGLQVNENEAAQFATDLSIYYTQSFAETELFKAQQKAAGL